MSKKVNKVRTEKCAEVVSLCIDVINSSKLSEAETVIAVSTLAGVIYRSITKFANAKLQDDEQYQSYARFVRRDFVNRLLNALEFSDKNSFDEMKGGKK